MNQSKWKLTRRKSIAIGATMLLGATAGCTDEADDDDENTGESHDSDENVTSTSDTSSSNLGDEETQSQESDGDESDEDSESTNENEETERDSGEEVEDIITVEGTYVAPVDNNTIVEEFTARSTVTTIDAFVLELIPVETDVPIELGSEGVELYLNEERITSQAEMLTHEDSSESVTIGISMDGVADPGEYTLRLKLDDPIIDPSESNIPVTKEIELSIEEPVGEIRTETIPAEDGFHIQFETNIAPGQKVETTHQTKRGEDPPFYSASEALVGPDGSFEIIGQFADFSGAETTFEANTTWGRSTVIETDITIGE